MPVSDTDLTIIRPLELDRWSDALTLLSNAGLPTADLEQNQIGEFLVVLGQGRVLGMIGLQCFGPCALLRSLVIDETVRGSGLGARLVADLEAKALAQDVQELWLLTIDANAFFERLGYRVANRESAPISIAASREFAELCPADAFLMTKRL